MTAKASAMSEPSPAVEQFDLWIEAGRTEKNYWRDLWRYRELLDKTKFYLSHPREAEKLREAGYRRARRDHTWQRRFEQLFQATALKQ